MFNNPELNKHASYSKENNTLSISNHEFSLSDIKEIGNYYNDSQRSIEFINCHLSPKLIKSDKPYLMKMWKYTGKVEQLIIKYDTESMDLSFVRALLAVLKEDTLIQHFQVSSASILETESFLKDLNEAVSHNTTLIQITIQGTASSEPLVLDAEYKGENPICAEISKKLSQNYAPSCKKKFWVVFNGALKEREFPFKKIENHFTLKELLTRILNSETTPSENYQFFREVYQKIFNSSVNKWYYNYDASPDYHDFIAFLYYLLTSRRKETFEKLGLDPYHQEFISPRDILTELESLTRSEKIEERFFLKTLLFVRLKAYGLEEARIKADPLFAARILVKLFHSGFTLPKAEINRELLSFLASQPTPDNIVKAVLYEKLGLTQSEGSEIPHYLHLAIELDYAPAKDSLRCYYHELFTKTPWKDLSLETICKVITDGFDEFKLLLARKIAEEGKEEDEGLIAACLSEGIQAAFIQQNRANCGEILRNFAKFLRRWVCTLTTMECRVLFNPNFKNSLSLLATIKVPTYSDSDLEHLYSTSFILKCLIHFLYRNREISPKQMHVILETLAGEIKKMGHPEMLEKDLFALAYATYRIPEKERSSFLSAVTAKIRENPLIHSEESHQRVLLFSDDSHSAYIMTERRWRDRSSTSLLANVCLMNKGIFKEENFSNTLSLLTQETLDHFMCLALNKDPQGLLVFQNLGKNLNLFVGRTWSGVITLTCYLLIFDALIPGSNFLKGHVWLDDLSRTIDLFTRLLDIRGKTCIPVESLEIVCKTIAKWINNSKIDEYLALQFPIQDETVLQENSEALKHYIQAKSAPPAPSAPAAGTMTLLKAAQPTPIAPPPGTQTILLEKLYEGAAVSEKLLTNYAPIIAQKDLTLGDLIAQGGQGDIHRAKWNGMDVAVKVLRNFSQDSGISSKLFTESQILSRLRHPSIVSFYAYTDPRERGQFCMVMEYYKNGSLSDYLYSPAQWESPMHWRLRCALEINQGLTYLHGQNILHLDVKPANALISSTWQAKLSDFGISRTLQTLQSHQTTANLNGTPAYMAPELFSSNEGPIHYTSKNDVYSFGILLWSCLTQNKPFDNCAPFQIMFQVASGKRPEIPAEASTKISDLIKLCWSQNPDERPETKTIDINLQGILLETGENQQECHPTKKTL